LARAYGPTYSNELITESNAVWSSARASLLGDETLDGGALWPLTSEEPLVDRLLVRRDVRDQWHARIVGGAAAYGLPLLAEPAPPLIDYLYNDPGDTPDN
jgi:hypothetical protein